MQLRKLISWLAPVLAAGCVAPADVPPRPPGEPAYTVVPDLRLRGRIAMVNSPGQFVVVDFNVGKIPPLETALNVYRGNERIGRVQLTGPSRDNLVAADVLEGELQPGDLAVWDEPPPPEPAPRPPS